MHAPDVHNRHNHLFYNNKQTYTSRPLLTGGHVRLHRDGLQAVPVGLPTMFTAAGGHDSFFPFFFPPFPHGTCPNTSHGTGTVPAGSTGTVDASARTDLRTGRAGILHDLQRWEQP